MNLKSERKYGIDMLRILSMLAIIGLHILNAGGVITDDAGITGTQVCLRFIIIVCYCSVDLFAMITGYLYAGRKKINSENIISLVTTTAFYCIVITVLFFVFKRDVFENKIMILYSLFPPLGRKYWYLTSYFIMFLLIPSMNRLIENMTKKEYMRLLLVMFITLSLITTFGLRDYFMINKGYSPFWLMFCYLAGGYIKLHSDREKTEKRRWIYLAAVLFNVLAVMFFWVVMNLLFKTSKGFETINGYVSPFTVCNAALLLLVFTTLDVRGGFFRRIVKSVSAASFDVYIIHCHILVFNVFFMEKFAFLNDFSAFSAVGMYLALGLCIYLLGYVTYIIRSVVFKVTCISKMLSFIGKKSDRLLPLNNTEN